MTSAIGKQASTQMRSGLRKEAQYPQRLGHHGWSWKELGVEQEVKMDLIGMEMVILMRFSLFLYRGFESLLSLQNSVHPVAGLRPPPNRCIQLPSA